MPETVNHCLLCGSETSDLFDRRTFEGKVVENRICQNCGFIFQSPRMTELENNQFYASEYRQLYQGSSSPSPKDLAIQELRAASLVSFVKDHVGEVSRFLDIGCSAGSLLKAMNSSYGCQTVGIEPGIAYREIATRTGIKVFGALQDLQCEKEAAFDLVSMAHVLEHIQEPLAYLVELREKILSPEGRLLIEVPNLYMHDSFEVAHLGSFSGHTLKQMVMSAGYDVIRMEKHGRPRSTILPYYLLLLCHPTRLKKKISFRKENKVRLKRRSGLMVRRIVSRFFPTLAWKEVSDEKGQVKSP